MKSTPSGWLQPKKTPKKGDFTPKKRYFYPKKSKKKGKTLGKTDYFPYVYSVIKQTPTNMENYLIYLAALFPLIILLASAVLDRLEDKEA